MNAPFVPPGSGWPGDPATPSTPVAESPSDVLRLADEAPTLSELIARQSVCRACPRLVSWREQVAVERRRAFASEEYWGRPVPSWGDADDPRVLIVGLGGARRKPYGPDLHRRPERRLAVRLAVPHRAGGAADERTA
jgi:uracil-DNA glycosylase